MWGRTRAKKLVLKDSGAKYKILGRQLFLSVLWIRCRTAFWPPLPLTGSQLYVTVSACVWLWVCHAGVELPAGGRGPVRWEPQMPAELAWNGASTHRAGGRETPAACTSWAEAGAPGGALQGGGRALSLWLPLPGVGTLSRWPGRRVWKRSRLGLKCHRLAVLTKI